MRGLGRGAVTAFGRRLLQRRAGAHRHRCVGRGRPVCHHPFTAYWNGSAWTKVKVPKVGATEELDSASTAPGGTIAWAFGRSTNSEGVVSNLTLRNG